MKHPVRQYVCPESLDDHAADWFWYSTQGSVIQRATCAYCRQPIFRPEPLSAFPQHEPLCWSEQYIIEEEPA